MGFALENVKAYVTKNTNGGSHAVLQKWSVTIDGENYPNEYANYTEILPADAAAFRATFRVPDVCSGNVMNCDNAHKKGLISDENLRFLRAGYLRALQGRHLLQGAAHHAREHVALL